VPSWRRSLVAAACLSAGLLSWAVVGAEEQAAVPLSLGAGTGGDGAWTALAAEHSPSTVTVDAGAGPEGTPAAVMAFTFTAGKYNWNWAQVACGSADPKPTVAVRFTYRTETPDDFPALNVILRESSGAAYWAPTALPLSPRRFTTVTLPLAAFAVPGWSRDENQTLDVPLVDTVGLGLATAAAGTGRVIVADVLLVPAGW
jgi:hypothetical protein